MSVANEESYRPSKATDATTEAVPPPMSYPQLFARFLKFGLLAWGGPVAQIDMLRRELVDEERWISSKRFNKLLAVMQVLPGPKRMKYAFIWASEQRGGWGACWRDSVSCFPDSC